MTMDYATEKKLRPLYEAIDEGQNKLALQHCAKLLKKNPDWPLALKSLTLVRSGKDSEALQLCEQVKKAIPTDEPTLQAVTLALKELGKHNMIVELYENAANQQPKNEEFGNQWFMAMVRNNDYKGQQAAAVKLQRVFKNDKYLFWAIMSLALQGQNGNMLSYTLAERMMAKALEEKRLQEVEHLRLYLLILMDQKKNKEALDLLLNNELGKKALRDPEVRQIKSELLRDSKRWAEVLVQSQEALEKENSDDWFSWLAYFEAVEALVVEESPEKVIEDAKNLIMTTQNMVLDSKILKRGPFLAELEFIHRLHKIGINQDQQLFLEKITSYFARFGSKSCAFEDIQAYISSLSQDKEKASHLIQSMKELIKPSSDMSTQVKNVYMNINIRKFERSLGLHQTSDIQQAHDVVNELWQQYQDALPLGKELERTELQYGDEFVILASHILLDLYCQHEQSSFIIEAISLLEIALAKSVYNFRIKLMLVRLYLMIGVYKRPFEIYKTMEIKQVQFDTMIHYFTDRFIPLGCSDDIESVLVDSMQIYRGNEVETPEMLVKAYQYGTYSKIQEFIEFRRRLDTSLQHTVTQIELKRIDFIRSSFQAKYAVQYFNENDVKELKYDDKHFEAASDNRDFKVFANYNSSDQPSAEEICKPAKSTNKVWAQMYSYILNILDAVCAAKEKRDLNALVQEAEKFIAADDIKENITVQEHYLASYITHLASALASIEANKASEATDKLNSAISIIQEQFCNVESFSENNTSWNTFHKVFNTLEAFSYTLVLVEAINRSLGLTSKEAKRKAAEAAEKDSLMACLFKLQEASKQSLQQMQVVVNAGKDLFRVQFQKKLFKEVTDSEKSAACLSLKDYQNTINHHIKMIVSSWGQSVIRLSEEIDRRLQKL
ncbi:hypothetical protein BCV72DRAFT_303592 [Rhizopus microsporus var. microsporus]|uniref:Uncharacterized protein n=2 Tax=Rhizopus microsporus TaxID=58291 RepID=A0A2G4T7U6_RHIZD|nr:uncharacterized protein RHIMIDRAFT_232531 [Rhizopus microsporus ATCC 52813]ORE08641.1 hypothetical protein BCV72DRAFT_303592 [Rhizopus microsporus var. microsporus]PHZ17094.1 hypothetical protein RHIMIDRAFT_232531 [Rhizopus microsporus ATCC 52813]